MEASAVVFGTKVNVLSSFQALAFRAATEINLVYIVLNLSRSTSSKWCFETSTFELQERILDA